LFKVTPSGIVTILHRFDEVHDDGKRPFGGVIEANDGNFYGTTDGTSSFSIPGVAFKITPTGTETIIHKFGPHGADSQNPDTTLLQASDGNFYGTTPKGGSSNRGTVYQMTPSGTLTVLHNFQDKSVKNDGAVPAGALIQASDGNFYGTTQYGGVSNQGTVFKMTPTGTMTILHSFRNECEDPGVAACTGKDGLLVFEGECPTEGLIEAGDGNLYGCAYSRIFKITLSGAYTVLYYFGDFYNFERPMPENMHHSRGLIEGSDGNLYGTSPAGGSFDAGTIYRVNVHLPPPKPKAAAIAPSDAEDK